MSNLSPFRVTKSDLGKAKFTVGHLLACERWERDYLKHGIADPTVTPWWAVAAALLKPEDASLILHVAMKRFRQKYDSDEQATLCIAIWQLSGKSEIRFIKNWFYGSSPERGSFPNCRGQLIEAMKRDADGREMVIALIRDQRLKNLDWQSLRQLVRAVNTWTETPIVAEDELREAWHPLGEGHYHWEKRKARKKYPEETKELAAHLREWRQRLRRSAPSLIDANTD